MTLTASLPGAIDFGTVGTPIIQTRIAACSVASYAALWNDPAADYRRSRGKVRMLRCLVRARTLRHRCVRFCSVGPERSRGWVYYLPSPVDTDSSPTKDMAGHHGSAEDCGVHRITKNLAMVRARHSRFPGILSVSLGLPSRRERIVFRHCLNGREPTPYPELIDRKT